jgi:hypothetical protein
MSEWKTYRLTEKHRWKCKPGYRICVLDRGAIRFDFPSGWQITQDTDCVRIRDRAHPDENCVMGVSNMLVPPVAWEVPLQEMVEASALEEGHVVLERGPAVAATRADGVEIAWREIRYQDPKEKRDISARLCIARGSGIHCLITFDFWTDSASKFQSVWDELLRSLDFALQVTDPTVGPVIQ